MRNIRRLSRFDGIVKQLCTYQSPDLGRPAFQTYRDLYVFAALVGFHMRREEVSGPDCTELDSRPFSSDDGTLEAMLSLAIAATQDKHLLLLANEDQVVDVFERYLNGGLSVISDWCAARPTDDAGVDAIYAGLVDSGVLVAPEQSPGDGVTF